MFVKQTVSWKDYAKWIRRTESFYRSSESTITDVSALIYFVFLVFNGRNVQRHRNLLCG